MNIDDKFKAISDGTRRKILDLLNEKSLTVSEIAELCDSTKPNISQHLNVLKNSGLVQDEKKGLYVYYTLKKSDVKETTKEVGKLFSIKDKIILDIQKIAFDKKCEPVLGTDSLDEGNLAIMKNTYRILSLNYSFRLSSFIVEFEIPSSLSKMQIEYHDEKNLEKFYSLIKQELEQFFYEEEKKEKMKETLIGQLYNYLSVKIKDMTLFGTKDEKTISQLKKHINDFLEQSYPHYFTATCDKEIFIDEIVLDITSLGKIHEFMIDDEVSEIMINASDEVWIERKGKFVLTDVKFRDNEEVMNLARKIVNHVGRRIDNSNPIVEARLPDGSRVMVVIPPIATKGVSIIVRKFFKETLKMDDLLKFNTISKDAALFLEECVKSRANIVISGGTGSGKTTTLNILSNYIPSNERIITIEDSAELNLDNEHVVRLETRPANAEGRGQISTRELLKAAIRMVSSRLIVSEIRDGAAFDILNAMSTGHDGAMFALHAINVSSALNRIGNLILQAGLELPTRFYSEMIANNIDIVVQTSRLKDGSMKITEISEVVGYNHMSESFIVEPIFIFEAEGFNDLGKINGNLEYTGYTCSERLLRKFDMFGCNPLHNLQIKQNDEKETLLKKQASLFAIIFADAIKSGFVISEAIKTLSYEMDEPLRSELHRLNAEMDSGKILGQAFNDFKLRINLPEYDLIVNSIMIQYNLGGSLERTLRNVSSYILKMEELTFSVPQFRHKYLFNNNDSEWQLFMFASLLGIACPGSKCLADAIEITCQYFDNRISKMFKKAFYEIQSGRRLRDALLSLTETVTDMDSFQLKTLITQIIQSEAFGTSVETAISSFANRMINLYCISSTMKYGQRRFL